MRIAIGVDEHAFLRLKPREDVEREVLEAASIYWLARSDSPTGRSSSAASCPRAARARPGLRGAAAWSESPPRAGRLMREERRRALLTGYQLFCGSGEKGEGPRIS